MKLASIKQKFVEAALRREIRHYGKVYMFHCVENDIKKDYENISITANGFKSFVKNLLSNESEFGRLENLKLGGENCSEIYITFDDIFESAYINAIPFLRENNIPYTVFICPAFIGREAYINEKQLEELKADPLCTVAAHSLHHTLACHEKQDNYKKEISQKTIEQLLGRKTELFAFPYGSFYACPAWAVNMVSKEGYQLAFSTVNAALVPRFTKENSFFLPRININEKNYKKYFKCSVGE